MSNNVRIEYSEHDSGQIVRDAKSDFSAEVMNGQNRLNQATHNLVKNERKLNEHANYLSNAT